MFSNAASDLHIGGSLKHLIPPLVLLNRIIIYWMFKPAVASRHVFEGIHSVVAGRQLICHDYYEAQTRS